MEENKKGSLEGAERQGGAYPLAPEMNPRDYLADMDDFDLTEAEKVELLETLWSILRTIVEIGAHVNDVNPCGQIFGNGEDLPDGLSNTVKSSFAKATETRENNKEGSPL